jgi:hypothetical protein
MDRISRGVGRARGGRTGQESMQYHIAGESHAQRHPQLNLSLLDGKRRRFSNFPSPSSLGAAQVLAGPDWRGCSRWLLTERLVGGKVADSLEAVLRCAHRPRRAAHALADVLAAPATAGNSERPEAAAPPTALGASRESHAGVTISRPLVSARTLGFRKSRQNG